MKTKIIVIFYLLISFLNLFNGQIVFASSPFAQAQNSVNLYKNPSDNDDITNIICIVEKTYFVEILDNYDEFYKVNYNGVIGYTKKNDVKEITNTPFTPYPYNIKLTINTTCNLRSSPTIKSQINNIITTLPAGENNFTFVGRIFSDEAIDFGGTTWYLVKYKGEYGYVYNKYIKSISPIYENNEEVSFKDEIPKTPKNPITNTPSFVMIILLFIPCLIILFILYLPRKIKNKKIKEINEIYKY